jgi:16S rRNA U516 pseudouridylate synthase RsuA-like enzyme
MQRTFASQIDVENSFQVLPRSESVSESQEDNNQQAVDSGSDSSGKQKLNVIIAASKLFSRREAESLIQQRRVTVAGQVITRPQFHVSDYDSNMIEIDGVPLRAKYNCEWPRLWAVQKYRQEIMSELDPNKSRSSLFDRLRNSLLSNAYKKFGTLKPVYRLRYQVEGLALMTNSGELARLLSNHPTEPLSLTYKVRVHGAINEGKLKALEQGVFIEGTRYSVKNVKRIPPFDKTNSWLELSVTDYNTNPNGLETMLKKMFLQPSRLISIGFGPFRAEQLFQSNSSSTHVTASQLMMEAKNSAAANGMVREIKLPPKLHAIVLRHMNTRHVVQPHHLITSTPSN